MFGLDIFPGSPPGDAEVVPEKGVTRFPPEGVFVQFSDRVSGQIFRKSRLEHGEGEDIAVTVKMVKEVAVEAVTYVSSQNRGERLGNYRLSGLTG